MCGTDAACSSHDAVGELRRAAQGDERSFDCAAGGDLGRRACLHDSHAMLGYGVGGLGSQQENVGGGKLGTLASELKCTRELGTACVGFSGQAVKHHEPAGCRRLAGLSVAWLHDSTGMSLPGGSPTQAASQSVVSVHHRRSTEPNVGSWKSVSGGTVSSRDRGMIQRDRRTSCTGAEEPAAGSMACGGDSGTRTSIGTEPIRDWKTWPIASGASG